MATTPYEKLSGMERAAILILSLDDAHAGMLFQRMDVEEVKELSQVMASLGQVTGETVERLLRDFGEELANSGTLVGSYDGTERILGQFMDKDKVAAIMDEIRGPAGRNIWDKLGNVNEVVLASYLKNEYPQTISVVLSKIRADVAAGVLTALPDDLAMECVMRMLRMETVQKEILQDVERTLKAEFMSNLAKSNRPDNHEVMADIFNYFDRDTEQRFMAMLEERNKESAERVKNLMFTFNDLTRLDAAGMQTLLRALPTERIALALKGADETIRNLFFSNMSARAGKILREDMEALGPVRLRDVDEAQAEIVTTAKDLSARGEIVLADGRNDELVY